MGRPGLLIVSLALAVISMSGPAWCVVYVKADSPPPPPAQVYDGTSWATAFRTIFEGAQAASAKPGGDEVWVAGGMYLLGLGGGIFLTDNVRLYGGFAGNEVSRDQRSIEHYETVIDADFCDIAIQIHDADNCVVDGFNIRNGASIYTGGGIDCYYASATISNNTFYQNGAGYAGGAISCYKSTVLIENNVIEEGTASFAGGGIYIRDSSETRVVGNTIKECAAQHGGGVYVMACSPDIDSNSITESLATGNGGGIFCRGASPLISNNIIARGRAGSNGGGVCVIDGSSPTIINCTISRNLADIGGGVSVRQNCSVRIANTILAYNSYVLSGGCVERGLDATVDLDHCCVYTNGATSFLPGTWNPVGQNGTFSADPMMVDTVWDFHLQAGSPCVDSGTSVGAPDHDIAGLLRPLDGNGDGTAVCDIGAYEYASAQAVTIGIAKRDLPDQSAVLFEDVIVTACLPDSSAVWVESPDRSAGIRVLASTMFQSGAVVDVEGTIRTDPGTGDRYVEAPSGVFTTGAVTPINPRFVTQRALGGGQFGLQPGVVGGTGLNNLGLLVSIAGRVTSVDPDNGRFYVDDGSALLDGTQTGSQDSLGIRVSYPPMDLQPGDQVRVYGISSSFVTPFGEVRRQVLATDATTVFPSSPSLAIGGVPDSDVPDVVGIHFTSVIGATAYRLYKSLDGADWQFASETTNVYEGFSLSVAENTYFIVKPVGPGGLEGAASKRIYARVQDPRVSFSLSQPGWNQTGVSRRPTVCWPNVTGAVRMMVEVHAFPMWPQPSGPTQWGAIIDHPSSTCAIFGQTARAVAYQRVTSILSPNTNYWLAVRAVDSENWMFGGCQDWPFTTGQ